MVFKSSIHIPGGGGVSALNGLAGSVDLISSDGSIDITPSGSTIDITTSGGGGGSIGGSIALNQVAVGSGANTIAGSSTLTFDGTTFQVDTGAILKGQYSNLAGSAYINPNGSAAFAGGSFVVDSAGNVTVGTVNGNTIGAGSTSGTNTGDQVVPANTTSTASNFFTAYNSTTGAFTKAQPAFTDISGIAAAGQLPLATTGAFGAVKPDGTTITISAGVISAVGGGSGTVTTTGSPATGNLTKFSGSTSITNADLTGDVTTSGTLATTLATVNANVGSFGSATQAGTFTVNAKGLLTAAGNTTITPAIGSVTGLGTGIATALGVNTGSAGAPVLFNGAGGTPSSITLTNATGTASGLTAGTVTTNANLTGAITSSGNATSLGSFSSANLRSALTDESGTGVAYFQGGDIGTPSAGVGTNLTGTAAGLTAGGNLAFKTYSVSGQSDVVADSTADTLTLVAGTNMIITTNAATDTITFTASGGGGSSTPLYAAFWDSQILSDIDSDNYFPFYDYSASTYNNGTAGVGATLTANANGDLNTTGPSLGIAVVGDNILINGIDNAFLPSPQSASHNGLYTITSLGSAGTKWVLTRHTSLDTAAKFVKGTQIITAPSIVGVTAPGINYVSTYYVGIPPTTIGTDDIKFAAVDPQNYIQIYDPSGYGYISKTTSNNVGSALQLSSIPGAALDSSSVILAKLQHASANKVLLGSGASGSGSSYSEITLGGGLSMTGTTLSSGGLTWNYNAATGNLAPNNVYLATFASGAITLTYTNSGFSAGDLVYIYNSGGNASNVITLNPGSAQFVDQTTGLSITQIPPGIGYLFFYQSTIAGFQGFKLGYGNTGGLTLNSNFTTTNTTATNTNMAFFADANETYIVKVWGSASKASSGTGMKVGFSIPSGATIKGEAYLGGALLATALTPSLITASGLGATFATGTAIEVGFFLEVSIKNSSTAGAVTFQGATVTSNTATILAGSRMSWTKVTKV